MIFTLEIEAQNMTCITKIKSDENLVPHEDLKYFFLELVQRRIDINGVLKNSN